MAAFLGLGVDSCEPTSDGHLEISSSRYFESHTDNREADARYRVGQGTYAVELEAHDGDSAPPTLWIDFKGVGRSESFSVDEMRCRQANQLITCVGTKLEDSHRRGPSRVTLRIRGRTILAMEIVELSPPSMEADTARYRPDTWPLVVATFRERSCRWGEPLRCE